MSFSSGAYLGSHSTASQWAEPIGAPDATPAALGAAWAKVYTPAEIARWASRNTAPQPVADPEAARYWAEQRRDASKRARRHAASREARVKPRQRDLARQIDGDAAANARPVCPCSCGLCRARGIALMAKDSSAEGVSRRRSRPSRHAPWDLARHIDRTGRRGRERRDE